MYSNTKKRKSIFDIINVTLMCVIAVTMIYPFWSIILTSIASVKDIVQNSFMIVPKSINLHAYEYIFTTDKIISGLLASIKVTLLGVAINMIVTLTYAYGLSVENLPGKKFLITYTIIPMFFSGGLIPLYITIKNYGLINTVWSMILPVSVNVFYLIVVKNHFTDIPKSIRESAMIDGANEFHIFIKILIPMSSAIIATILLFYSIERWNEWFFSSIFVSSDKLFTLQKVLRDILINDSLVGDLSESLKNSSKTFVDSQAVRMATAVVAILPIALVYPLLQKYYVAGVSTGAVKE